MKTTVQLLVVVACVFVLGIGCPSSGNGGGDGGTVTVSVTGLTELLFETPVMVYGVFEASADWDGDPADDYVGYGVDYVVDAAVSCMAVNEATQATWRGSVGEEYYVIVFVTEYNAGEEYDPLQGGNWVLGSAGYPEPSYFVLEEATTLQFTQSDFTQVPTD